MFGEQDYELSMKASTTRKKLCLGNRRLASGAAIALAKGPVSWLSMMQAVRPSVTSEAGYIALSEAVEEVFVLRQEVVQKFIELSMRIPRVHRRAGLSILMREMTW